MAIKELTKSTASDAQLEVDHPSTDTAHVAVVLTDADFDREWELLVHPFVD